LNPSADSTRDSSVLSSSKETPVPAGNARSGVVQFAKTGVKFCQAKAKLKDVGVYFEANGHGTVHFSDRFSQALHKVIDDAEGKLHCHVLT
jgi:hypothetical protein